MSSQAEDLPELEGFITISLAGAMLGVTRQGAHAMVKGPRPRLRAWRIPSAGLDRPVVVMRSDVEALLAGRPPVVEVPTEDATPADPIH